MINLKDIIRGKIYTDKDIPPFKISEDLYTPAKYSSDEAKLHIDADIKKMSQY